MRIDGMMLLAWLALEALLWALPTLQHSPTPGDDLTRWTVRLALGYYATATTLLLGLRRPADWRAATDRGRLARSAWTLGWTSYLVHLATAFHFYHNWSHADAIDHTRAVSGWGEGIYISHLFTLAWTLDVVYWWLRPAGYAARPGWVDGLLHGFMAFIVFNGTVVYESGPIRWFGLALFGWLAALLVRHWAERRTKTGG